MRRAFLPVTLVLLTASGGAAEESWLSWLSPALRTVEREQVAVRHELASLGTPVVGQTVPEFGYMHTRPAHRPRRLARGQLHRP